jgi:hypothetical protein
MRTKRILYWAGAPAALLVLAVALQPWERALSATDSHAVAPAAPRIAQSVAEDERVLEEQRTELIAAKVIEGVTAKLTELSIPSNTGLTDPSSAAEPLNREITELRKEVKELTEFNRSLSVYTKEIEHSLVNIDTGLSTPSVLRNKLNQQQTGLKP